ncbi:MAG: hypothetical protein Q8P26_00670 [Candidatus Levybacteria bacterium]|nr:hypothetical protein [Candidatus Levybacteria bacterium]
MTGLDALIKNFTIRKEGYLQELKKIELDIEEVSKQLNSKPKDRIKEDLVKKANTKTAQYLVQIDGHLGVPYSNENLVGDEDNDYIALQQVWELCDFEDIRVQFPPETDPETVLRVLNKITWWISKFGDKKQWNEFKLERFSKEYHPKEPIIISSTVKDDDLPF